MRSVENWSFHIHWMSKSNWLKGITAWDEIPSSLSEEVTSVCWFGRDFRSMNPQVPPGLESTEGTLFLLSCLKLGGLCGFLPVIVFRGLFITWRLSTDSSEKAKCLEVRCYNNEHCAIYRNFLWTVFQSLLFGIVDHSYSVLQFRTSFF